MNFGTKLEDDLTFEVIAQQFHLPLRQAAEALGTSQSTLKRRCRKVNIKQWPFRKIMVLMNKVPTSSSEESKNNLSVIMDYLRRSPDAVNEFTDKNFHHLTFEMFHEMSTGKKKPLTNPDQRHSSTDPRRERQKIEQQKWNDFTNITLPQIMQSNNQQQSVNQQQQLLPSINEIFKFIPPSNEQSLKRQRSGAFVQQQRVGIRPNSWVL